MKKDKVFIFILIFFFLQLFSIEKHVIGARPWGFFSDFFTVVIHLIGCKQNDLVPVVYWDNKSSYYVDNGKKYNNVWEYYFKPVSNLKFEPGDKIHRNYHFSGAPSIQWKMPNYVHNFNYDFRKHMNSIIQEYIKIKSSVKNKIDSFYAKNIKNKKTIGIHVRHSKDKIPESPLIDVDVFLKIVSKYEGYQIFIASDNYSVIEKFKKRFPGRVIFYNSHRSSNSSAHYLGRDKKDPLNAILGEEVLIEAIILSKCDLFVHSVSNVATAVLFFNPKLQHIFLDPTKIMI